MSQFTNYGENKVADYFRGQGLTLPSSWYIAPLSAYSDSSVTEITSLGLSRAAVTRSLANFSGTQGSGTTLASSGSSNATSNNGTISLGTATGSGTMVAVGFFDASSSGNCWMVFEFSTPVSLSNGTPVSIDPDKIAFTLGVYGGLTAYAANKLIDLIFRGQAYSWPSNTYAALYTEAPSISGGGTEASGPGYARVAIASSMAAWSGTQGTGTTVASSGTGGRIGNNEPIVFAKPDGLWGDIGYVGLKDAGSLGNLLLWHQLAQIKTVGASSNPPQFGIDALGITIA